VARALKVVPGRPPIPAWNSLWSSFELELLGEQGVSPATPRAYRESARQFVAYLEARDRPTEPALIERDDVQGFLAALRERGAKDATIRVRFSSFRRFFRCEEEEEIQRSPMHRMHRPKVDEPPLQVLSDEEIAALLRACEGKTFEDRRDMALIRLMIDSGLRRFEAAGVAVEIWTSRGGRFGSWGRGSERRWPTSGRRRPATWTATCEFGPCTGWCVRGRTSASVGAGTANSSIPCGRPRRGSSARTASTTW
jgi:site-specific recombinase XerD